jgi:L-idonate 5-dehydrogenase
VSVNQAIVIHAARDLRVEDRAAETPGPGQVEITLKAGGICGSDLHYYAHGGFGAVRLREPMILGHEVAGEVTGLGVGATGLALGDVVAVSPSRPCEACPQCLAGRPNHCLNMRFYGSAMPMPHIQGAFRRKLIADASQCHKLHHRGADAGAFAEPLAVVLHGLKRAGDMMGAKALVTGCGPIGALAILALKRAGAARIVATDIAAAALARAMDLGADEAINIAERPEDLSAYGANKGTFDVMFECSGAPSAVVAGLEALRPGAVLVQLGLGAQASFPINLLVSKEIEMRGSFRFHPEFAHAVAMIDRAEIDPMPLLTHRFGLDRATEAFDMALDRRQAMKVQIAF